MLIRISCFQLVLLEKASTGCILLHISLMLLLMLNMCLCLAMICFIFSSFGLNVTENGIECSRLNLQVFKIALTK